MSRLRAISHEFLPLERSWKGKLYLRGSIQTQLERIIAETN